MFSASDGNPKTGGTGGFDRLKTLDRVDKRSALAPAQATP